MTLVYALVVAAYVGCGLYMTLSRHAVRMVLGLALLTNGAILLLFLSGRVGTSTPPVIPLGADALAADAANALPQALVLTAIVIGFALTAFAVALVLVAHRKLGTLDLREMRDAERLGAPDTPLSASVKNNG
ncbi:MAG: sodium:proton antiporter [Salinarimonas sp.]